MKIKIFHHSADPDGWCSGAIALQALQQDTLLTGAEVELAPINYDKSDTIPEIAADVDEVYILDFSFKPEVMEQLASRFGSGLIWIDHHKRAIAEVEAVIGSQTFGTRDSTVAACEQVWRYFNNEAIPRAVQLIGDYDVWKFEYGDETRHFNAGLCAQTNVSDASDPQWAKLLCDEDFVIQRMIDDGVLVLGMKTQFAEQLLKGARTIDWMGHKTLVVNISPIGWLASHTAQIARDHPELYPGEVFIAWSMWQDEEGQSQVGFSLRSLTDDVDVSALASQHGGGGHKAAAGFGFIGSQIPYLEQLVCDGQEK